MATATTTQPTSFVASQGPQAYSTPPNSQGYQYPPQHYTQSQYSPGPSAVDTPMNQPPQSPRNTNDFPNLPLATRQIRPLKSPMYIPAALRPTDRPQRPPPLTPPRSNHGSTDSLDKSTNRPLSRRSTHTLDGKKKGLLTLATEAEIAAMDTSDLPPITNAPKRDHWKPDANASICDGPTCQKSFGLFERRHHCRHCGNVFCGEHSRLQVPLDQEADFHPGGTWCRCCEHCWGQFVGWKEERIARARGVSDEVEVGGRSEGKMIEGRGGGEGQVAGSVSRDWSTF